ncbi:MAG: S8 family serine peptidase, partial [Actinomycetota bacterium]|nr:S8 family serine peptidase [Actinomycetota bacterium]
SGEQAQLLGAGYGGSAPYSFAWKSEHGKLVGADAATAALDTTGLAAGRYTVSLAITDAAGNTASDTVVVVVYEEAERTLLAESKADTTPGVTGTGAAVKFPVEVPAGTSSITVDLTWGVAANDYDLRVLDPSGKVAASSGHAPPEFEQATVANPAAGTWTVVADKYATFTDTVRAVVTAKVSRSDPRPSVRSGGPYAFQTGAEQKLEGTVSGGVAPVQVGWDLDGDGRFETPGTDVTAQLVEGRHLVTIKATDASGLERRETTSVLVASPERLAQDTTAVTVIGVADTGINPYHLEFSAQTYPDPDVLALTDNFTRHPSEYIPGYPAGAQALPVTLGQGYYPAADKGIWTGNTTIKPGSLYWIPGTKIVGAIDAGGSTGVTSGDDPHPILDDNGHGSGSASVSAGNRYGYCPTCLLVVVEALDETVVAKLPWVDISTNSFGYVGGIPIGLLVGGSEETREAAERGQTTLFAAGNGVGNAFDVPISTYGSDQTGPDWNITVGALRRDNQRAIVGDGIPVHISAWGDGNLPSACRSGTVGQCAFGGTSAATPYTAGVFGTVLTNVRQSVGDGRAGQKPGQVVAQGVPVDESVYLADGKLTRTELREAVLKTAYPLNQDNAASPFPVPLTAPYSGGANVLFEGYGAATPESAKRAVDVLLGRSQLPERPFEDDFFELDRAVRDTIYGGYDRDGDGSVDSEAIAGGLGVSAEQLATVDGALAALRTASAKVAGDAAESVGENLLGDSAETYFLHRRQATTPDKPRTCAAIDNESYMNRTDSTGDLEPCFESRVTSVVAAYRPLGIFASEDLLDAPLPAGSRVDVEIFLAGETPSVIRPTGVLMATDREIGKGAGALQPVAGSGPGGAACRTLGEACWTRYRLSFETTRPAFTGEHLTFQIQLVGARSWAFGFEGAHASKLTVTPAALPATGFEFGASISSPVDGSEVGEGEKVVAGGSFAFPDQGSDPTGAGDHPTTQRVEVSLDDASFAKPVEAKLDADSGTWSAPLGEAALGEHTVYARARIDGRTSEVSSSTFTVVERNEVQWQVVERNAPADAAAWKPATGVAQWQFTSDTAAHGKGPRTIVVRLTEGGIETARTGVTATFR